MTHHTDNQSTSAQTEQEQEQKDWEVTAKKINSLMSFCGQIIGSIHDDMVLANDKAQKSGEKLDYEILDLQYDLAELIIKSALSHLDQIIDAQRR